MSLICGFPLLESVYCIGCARWLWKKCLYSAGNESENWGLATAEEFENVPHLSRLILAGYEEDLLNPLWAPSGGYRINPEWVILRKHYGDTGGVVPPYMIYLDHENADIVFVMRGLSLVNQSDYAVLLDNKLGQTEFDGGYVHNGLLKGACWVLEAECETLRGLVERYGNYTLTFTGHSLGAGVVTLLTIVAVQNRGKLANIERRRIRCYAIAPARCVSLNLAVRYADIINSIVLQDDFLPRTTVALKDVFRSIFCLPCLLCIMCLKDTCKLEETILKDPRRLYAPGRLYHIVERKPFRCGRFPPVVRTAVPVDGRFEHLVFSCNATSDHAIIWIERESQRALEQLMLERERIKEIPPKQRMERHQSLIREHTEEYRAALQRAVALNVPSADSPSIYGTFCEVREGENPSSSSQDDTSLIFSSQKRRESWDAFIGRILCTDESGKMILKKS